MGLIANHLSMHCHNGLISADDRFFLSRNEFLDIAIQSLNNTFLDFNLILHSLIFSVAPKKFESVIFSRRR